MADGIRYGALCMVFVLVLGVVGIGPAEAGKFNAVLDVGDKAPEWQALEGIDGKKHALGDFDAAKAVVVVFTCNHCPIAQAYQERIKEFVKRNRDRNVQLVAISVSLEKIDNLEAMKTHAKENGFSFPYLHDPSQQSGRAYGASVTPHAFVLDGERRIAYMGAFDDDFTGRNVTEQYVQDAVDAVLSGGKPEVTESRQTGCHIQYAADASTPARPE